MRQDVLKLLRQMLRGELRRNRRRKGAGPIIVSVLIIAAFGALQFLEEPDAPLPAKGAELICKISAVYDGDTVTASCDQGKLKVRVFGIDAPEMGQKPWGKASRDVLRGLVPRDDVRLEVVDKDSYGRVVARLYDGSRDLGLDLVRQGHAVVYTRYNNSKVYQEAEAEAKRDRLGIWSRPGAQQEPWEWRKVNPRG